MKAVWNGQVIAESNETLKLEGNHYFPLKSVNKDFLKESSTTTFCPWKGAARYYSIANKDDVQRDVAWCYLNPKPAAAEIRDHIAFWRGVEIIE